MTSTSHTQQHDRRWLILALVGVAQLMVVLDSTIVNIALPSAQRDLGFSDDSRQWIVTAYALAFGSLLLLGGKLGDLFGRKWTFIAGLTGFAAASALGGLASSFAVLVGARALQGAFGALLAPSALSLLSTTFTDAKERGTAFGVYGAIAGSGAAIGLLLGGLLTDVLSWRWCLYVNLAFAVPAAVAGLRLIVNERPAERPRIDVPGIALVSSGLFALVYGFSNAETDSWGAPLTVGMLAGSVVLLAAFVARQRTAEHPLLPLRVVLDRDRGGAYLAVAIAGLGMFGMFLFLTYYLQRTLGYSPLKTGLAFLPMSAAVVAAATTTTTRLLPRTGARPLVPTGMALAMVAMILLTRVDVGSGYVADVLPSLIVFGLGLGLIIAPSMATATLGVDASDAGVASAMVNTGQQIGGSIGTALLSTVFSSAVTSYASDHASLGRAALGEAQIHGYSTVFWCSAVVFGIGAVVTGLLLRSGAPEPVAEGAGAPVMAH